MGQILLQVSVYLFHTFTLTNNKIDKNLILRLYGGKRYQVLILHMYMFLIIYPVLDYLQNETRMKSQEQF